MENQQRQSQSVHSHHNNITVLPSLHLVQKTKRLKSTRRNAIMDEQPKNPTHLPNFNQQLSKCQKLILLTRAIRASKAFHQIYLAVTIISGLSMLITSPQQNSKLAQQTEFISMICHCIFILFTILRLISLQPLHYGWCTLEFIAMISGISLFFVRSEEVANILKAITCLRVIIIVRYTALYRPFKNMIESMKNIGRIIGPALILIFLFSVIGLHAFVGNQYNRCRSPTQKYKTSNWTYEKSITYLCGNRQCPIVNNQQLQCLNPLDYDVEANPEQLSEIWLGFGLLSYSNIFNSFFNTYKMIFLTGWSRSVILMKQTMNEIIVLLYYLSFIYVVSYLYMNIIYGMMMMNEHENNPKKITYNELEDRESKINFFKKSISKSSSNQISSTFNEDVLIVVHKKYKDDDEQEKNPLIDDEMNDNTIILRKDFYLPQNPQTKEKILKVARAYQYFNNFMIIWACLNHFLIDDFSNPQMAYIFGILDIIFMIQFAVHVIGSSFVEIFKEQQLKEWYKSKRIKQRNVQIFDMDVKAQIGIFMACMTGVLYEIALHESYYQFIVPTRTFAHVFRAFKYLRIFILIKNQQFFKDWGIILKSTYKVIDKAMSFILFYLLMIIVFVLFGYYAFHHPQQKQSLASFDGIYNSFVLTFLVFYNEQWDMIMFWEYQHHQCLPIALYFIFCVTIGVVFLSKYLTALLVNELMNQLEKVEQKQNERKEIMRRLEEQEMQKKEEQKEQKEQQMKTMNVQNKIMPIEVNILNFLQSADEEKTKQKHSEGSVYKCSVNLNITNLNKKMQHDQQNLQKEQVQNRPSRCQKIGGLLKQFYATKYYCSLYMTLVFLNMCEVGHQGPTQNPNSQRYELFAKIGKLCSSLYLLDLILQLLLFGLWQPDNSYLKKLKTNFINIIILVFQLLLFLPSLASNQTLTSLENLKFLRLIVVLEMMSLRFKTLKYTIIGYAKLVPKVFSFLTLVCVLYGFFAIILARSYSGQFWHCVNHVSEAKIDDKYDCLNWGGDWVQQSINTNNSRSSLVYVMLIAATEGWMSLMSFLSSLRGIDKQPHLNANENIKLFFLFFFFFGNMIVLNLFIGVNIHTMNNITKKEKGTQKLSKSQMDWLMIKQKIHSIKLSPYIQFKQNSISAKCQKISKSKAYKIIKFIIIVLFLLRICIVYSGFILQARLRIFRDQLVFALISLICYIIETVGKKKKRSISIWAFHVIFYTYFFMCIVIYQTRFTKDLNENQFRLISIILLAFQIFKYWFYIYEFQYVRKTLKFMQIIIPQAFPNIFTMIIFLFLYAFLGTQLFSYLKPNTELNEFDQNYGNFFNAMFSLIKFSTWQAPIDQISNASQQMTPNHICFQINTYSDFVKYGLNGCGSSVKAYLFFMSFHVFYSMIMISSLTANIFQSFCQVKKQEQITVDEFQLEKVTQSWSSFDVQATGFLPYHHFWRFFSTIHTIYGLSSERFISNQDKSSFLAKLNLQVYEKNGVLGFQFYETIEGLIRILLSKKYREIVGQNKADQVFRNVNEMKQHKLVKSPFTSKDVFTIIITKTGLRKWKLKAMHGFHPSPFNMKPINNVGRRQNLFCSQENDEASKQEEDTKNYVTF